MLFCFAFSEKVTISTFLVRSFLCAFWDLVPQLGYLNVVALGLVCVFCLMSNRCTFEGSGIWDMSISHFQNVYPHLPTSFETKKREEIGPILFFTLFHLVRRSLFDRAFHLWPPFKTFLRLIINLRLLEFCSF